MTSMSEALVTSQFSTATNQRAICEFRQAKFRGFISKVWATITGQSHKLLDVKIITQGKSVRNRRYAGSQTVSISQIKGSEGRCQDFDQDFNPLKSHNKNRWISVANAWERGTYLPAVDLIKIGDVYVVRDGHHRISVAKFNGCNFIDAQVTEWILADELIPSASI
jgi:hypothetical protein